MECPEIFFVIGVISIIVGLVSKINYIFIFGVVFILLSLIMLGIYYAYSPKDNTLLQLEPDTDIKSTHPVWLCIKIFDKHWGLCETDHGLSLTDDLNLTTIYRHHRSNSPLLKKIGITPTEGSVYLESENRIFEIQYVTSCTHTDYIVAYGADVSAVRTVHPILRYSMNLGLTTRYLHLNNEKLITDKNSNNLIEMELPGYWHR